MTGMKYSISPTQRFCQIENEWFNKNAVLIPLYN